MVVSSAFRFVSVLVRNNQRALKVNVPLLRQQVMQLIQLFKLENYDIAVVLVGAKKMAAINAQYKSAIGATDVLSFPFHEVKDMVPGNLPKPYSECDYNIGDIIICPKAVSERFGTSALQQQLPVYVTHGICHLIGYTHDDAKSQLQMFNVEQDVLTQFNVINGYNLTPLTSLP